MKQFALFVITLLIAITLTACTHEESITAQVSRDLSRESWMQRINTHPKLWLKGVDPWYFTGEPYQLSTYAKNAPYAATITDTQIRPTHFNNINIAGSFKVQIVGHQESNSIEIMGPNYGVRQIMVSTRNRTLYLEQNPEYKGNLSNVIVRIGIRNLKQLTASGTGCITGREITSNNLVINSISAGTILLDGNMNVTQINQEGPGCIIVLGAYTRSLTITAHNRGTVNVAGRIGIRCISNLGCGIVNIIGAMSNDLVIEAGDKSSTRVVGFVNVKKVTASGKSCVQIYWVCSSDIRIIARDQSRVSLAGYAGNLTVDACNSARFEGKCLRAQSVFVRTYDAAHANVSAVKKIFADARGTSSIYYYGAPSRISRFFSGNGAIIPVWTNEIPTPAYPDRQMVLTQFKMQEVNPTGW